MANILHSGPESECQRVAVTWNSNHQATTQRDIEDSPTQRPRLWPRSSRLGTLNIFKYLRNCIEKGPLVTKTSGFPWPCPHSRVFYSWRLQTVGWALGLGVHIHRQVPPVVTSVSSSPWSCLYLLLGVCEPSLPLWQQLSLKGFKIFYHVYWGDIG